MEQLHQRGVAYDGASDVFYVGGWNEGIVYRVAGPSWPTPGETLSQCNPADPNISGLAWNGSFGMLWEATNSDTDTIFLIDPTTCETVRAIDHLDGGGFGGAGHRARRGRQHLDGRPERGNAYLIESGLPTFSDVAVAVGEPDVGHGRQGRQRSADGHGQLGGPHARRVPAAIVVVQTNDPDNSIMQIPVVLVVPRYQQGVNAGGNAYVDPTTGDLYATDRAFSAGGFGYVGGTSRSTPAAIGGTERDPLYQDLRQGMSAYRFAVPNGVYGSTCRSRRFSSRRPAAASSASRWRAPPSSRTSTCSPPPAASASPTTARSPSRSPTASSTSASSPSAATSRSSTRSS